jgi:cell wall-associated NlpC family hydrolase
MITRKMICDKTREYLKTPYQHSGRVKGIGVDCAGLIICVAKELDVYRGQDIQGYTRIPDGKELLKAIQLKAGKRKDLNEAKEGDILLMRFAEEPQHLGILVEDNYLVHSYVRAREVTIHRFSQDWQDKVIGVYEFPEIEEEKD